MSEADKMFKKLKYHKKEKPADEDALLFYSNVEEDVAKYIIFFRNKTFVAVGSDRDYWLEIDKDLLKAINKKVEELGWN
jgi:hypothetical protein